MIRLVATAAAVLLAGCSLPPDGRPEERATGRADAGATAGLARRAVHTATALSDGSVLVAGGCVDDGCSTATASTVLVGPNGMPSGGAAMSVPRDAHSATLLADGTVLVAGGYPGESRAPLGALERWRPGPASWQPAGSLRTPRGGHAAAVLGDGRVLLAGGATARAAATRSTELVDSGTGRVTAGPDLPAAVDAPAAAALPDGSVLLSGGRLPDGRPSAHAVLVRPDGSLTKVGPLSRPRFKHEMVTLPSGLVLAVGGTDDDRRLLDSSELYDPATGTFRPGPALAAGRYKLRGAVAALADGRVVVAGGGPGVEVLDPVRGTSTALRAVPAVRSSYSTVTVQRDRVLVLGGYDERVRLTGTYRPIPLDRLNEGS